MQAIYLDVTAEQLARHSVLQSCVTAQEQDVVAVQPYIRVCMQEPSEDRLRQQLAKLIVAESILWVMQRQRHKHDLLRDKRHWSLIVQRVRQRAAQMQPQLALLIESDMEHLHKAYALEQKDCDCIPSWNIDGYLQFSAKKVKWAIETVLQEELQGYQDEQDREEFISLLQFCVAVQPSLLDDVYLTLQANQFTMVDLWGNDLQQIYLDALPKEEYADVQMHDLILSILMTMLPQTIHLFVNTEQMNAEQQVQQKKLVQLLQQIFPNRLLMER